MQIYPDAARAREGEQFLKGEMETRARFERVSRLIEGYETPYGMELLARVYWIAVPKMKTPKLTPTSLVFSVGTNTSPRRSRLIGLSRVGNG